MKAPLLTGRRLAAVISVSLCAAAGATTACSAGASDRAAASSSAPVLTVQSSLLRDRPIGPGFVGLSMEFQTIPAYAGMDPQNVDPVFEQLLRNLAPGGSPVLRIGGDSTDWTWWPVPGVARPGGVTYDLGSRWLAVVRSLLDAVDGRLIVGVNFEADSGRVASAEARAILGAIGQARLAAIELGNEPELYRSFGWYRNAAGRPVMGRPLSYDFAAFTHDFANVARALPPTPLAGPSVGSPAWLSRLGDFLGIVPRVGLVTLHRYPLARCASSRAITTGDLLSNAASMGLADSVAGNVAVAHSRGVPVRIDEMNSISCGGQPGVSDSFASALWSLDAMFEMARVGVDGVNFHSHLHVPNELFTIGRTGGTWHAFVHPVYYGLTMFSQAAPPGSQLLFVSGLDNGPLRAWATRAPDRRIRVVLINKDPAQGRVVTLRVPSAVGAGTLVRLSAPSVNATAGVTLGGQTFGAQTTSGLLGGVPSPTTIAPVRGGYAVDMPAGSAAVLTLPMR